MLITFIYEHTIAHFYTSSHIFWHRSELFICSKLWNEHHAPSDVCSALQNTLKNLGLEYLDLYLMHWPFAFKREHPHHFPEVIPKPQVRGLNITKMKKFLIKTLTWQRQNAKIKKNFIFLD